MNNLVASYTAANTFPYKLFREPRTAAALREGRIPPAHVQLIPTNRCNLGCSFCSCAERDKGQELLFPEIQRAMQELAALGAVAVTITGGGEPLLHPQINDVVAYCHWLGLKVGLVTNGVGAELLSDAALARLTWLRFSCSDELPLGKALAAVIGSAVRRAAGRCDFAFSYVVTKRLRLGNLVEYIALANELGFSHVRVVSDLTDLEGAPAMDVLRRMVRPCVDDSRVIYQGRKEFTQGAERCWISLLKPVVSADGYLFPCCGAQYAEESPALDLRGGMKMGEIGDIGEPWQKRRPFDGRRCVRCYYGAYNEALEAMLGDLRHVEFV